jgi:hypothetical protein
MKVIPAISYKTHLIWLIFFALLLSPGLRDGVDSKSNPLRHLRQTELTLTSQDQKPEKISLFGYTGFTLNQNAGFSGDLLLLTRITRHTEVAVLKWKVSRKHVLTPTIKFVQVKTAQNDNEDLSLLKG